MANVENSERVKFREEGATVLVLVLHPTQPTQLSELLP
jgi:hypothetical protein